MSLGLIAEIIKPPAQLVAFRQVEPAPLHIQKVLFEHLISLSGGFARAILGVRVALTDLFAQTFKHQNRCLSGDGMRRWDDGRWDDGRWDDGRWDDGVSTAGGGIVVRPVYPRHNATKANLTVLRNCGPLQFALAI